MSLHERWSKLSKVCSCQGVAAEVRQAGWVRDTHQPGAGRRWHSMRPHQPPEDGQLDRHQASRAKPLKYR